MEAATIASAKPSARCAAVATQQRGLLWNVRAWSRQDVGSTSGRLGELDGRELHAHAGKAGAELQGRLARWAHSSTQVRSSRHPAGADMCAAHLRMAQQQLAGN